MIEYGLVVGRGSLLLSIRYGIPNTIIILTPAIRIIGFLSRLRGETISVSVSKTLHSNEPCSRPENR